MIPQPLFVFFHHHFADDWAGKREKPGAGQLLITGSTKGWGLESNLE